MPLAQACEVNVLALQLVLKRYAASASASVTGLKPMDLRLTAVQSAFQLLRCSADVDMTAPVPQALAFGAARALGRAAVQAPWHTCPM